MWTAVLVWRSASRSRSAPRRRPATAVRAIAVALGLAGAAAWPALAAPAPVLCEGAPAEVHGGNGEDRATACAGARDAIEFLSRVGVPAPARIAIHVVGQLPPDLRVDAVGCYVVASGCVHVLDSGAFLARQEWFRLPTSPALHRSVFAHEIAHAIVASRVEPGRLSTAALEYIAYVVMFATMPADLRARVLAAAPGDVDVDEASFNDLVYAFDPTRFGINAYRHWSRHSDGGAFLRRVLAGEVMPKLYLY
jgi:hypothetical protein